MKNLDLRMHIEKTFVLRFYPNVFFDAWFVYGKVVESYGNKNCVMWKLEFRLNWLSTSCIMGPQPQLDGATPFVKCGRLALTVWRYVY